MFNPITILLINHPIMTWKMGDSVYKKNHKGKKGKLQVEDIEGFLVRLGQLMTLSSYPWPEGEYPWSFPGDDSK